MKKKILIVLPILFSLIIGIGRTRFAICAPLGIEQETKDEEGFTERVGSPTGNLQEKIKQLRETLKERAREKIQEAKQNTPRGYAGEITALGENEFTLKTPRRTLQISVSTETKIIGKQKQPINFTDLKVGDFVIVMGYLDEEENLQARRIVVAAKSKRFIRHIAFGKVTQISSEEENILTVKNEKKGIVWTIIVPENTVITKKISGKIQKTQFSSIEIGDNVIVVGIPKEDETKIITAKIIHIIPGLVNKPTKPLSPTPSPSQKVSPSSEE